MGVGSRAGVTIVDTVEMARDVLQRLFAADLDLVHACDTEVMDIDVKAVGPVGNGFVTCVSMYSGPDFDYGEGPGKALFCAEHQKTGVAVGLAIGGLGR